jgi:hypothetical protein
MRLKLYLSLCLPKLATLIDLRRGRSSWRPGQVLARMAPFLDIDTVLLPVTITQALSVMLSRAERFNHHVFELLAQ